MNKHLVALPIDKTTYYTRLYLHEFASNMSNEKFHIIPRYQIIIKDTNTNSSVNLVVNTYKFCTTTR